MTKCEYINQSKEITETYLSNKTAENINKNAIILWWQWENFVLKSDIYWISQLQKWTINWPLVWMTIDIEKQTGWNFLNNVEDQIKNIDLRNKTLADNFILPEQAKLLIRKEYDIDNIEKMVKELGINSKDWFSNMVWAQEMISHDLWIKKSTNAKITSTIPFWSRKFTTYMEYSFANYLQEYQTWIDNTLKRWGEYTIWRESDYVTFNQQVSIMREKWNLLNYIKSSPWNEYALFNDVYEWAFLKWLWADSPMQNREYWSKFMNDLQTLSWSKYWIRESSYEYIKAWHWFSNETETWLELVINSARRNFWVANALFSGISKASRWLSWFTNISNLVTSTLWYKTSLDTRNLLWTQAIYKTEDVMSELWISNQWIFRQRLNEYLDGAQISDAWIIDKLSIFLAQALEWKSWLKELEFKKSVSDLIMNYAYSKDSSLVPLFTKISWISNWFQDIADIVWAHRVTMNAFERAAHNFWWIDNLMYRKTSLETEYNLAIRSWDLAKWEEIKYNLFELRRDLNSEYLNQIRILNLDQSYANTRWRLIKRVSAIWLNHQAGRWMSKMWYNIAELWRFWKWAMPAILGWSITKLDEFALNSRHTQPVMQLLWNMMISNKYSHYIDSYLDNKSWEEKWTIERIYDSLDSLSRTNDMIQAMFANAPTRIILNAIRTWSDMFVSKQKWDEQEFYNNFAKLFDRSFWEFWAQFKSVNELSKLYKNIRSSWAPIDEVIWWYFVDKFMRTYYSNNLSNTDWNNDIVYETPNSFVYFLLWWTNDMFKFTLDNTQRKRTQEYLLARPDWLYWLFMESAWSSNIIWRIIKTFKSTPFIQADIWQMDQVYFGSMKEAIDRWDNKYILSSIDAWWETKDIRSWRTKNIISRIIDVDTADFWLAKYDDEWNFLSWTVSEEIQSQYNIWNTTVDSSKEYLKRIKSSYTSNEIPLSLIFWEEWEKRILAQYWPSIKNKQNLENMLKDQWKDWMFYRLIATAWIDTSQPWWWAVMLRKLASIDFNYMKNWDQSVVDPKTYELLDTKQTVRNAMQYAINNWNKELVDSINEWFFKKKKWVPTNEFKNTFSKAIEINEDWWYSVLSKSNPLRIENINNYLISKYLPYIKSVDIPMYSDILLETAFYTEYLWWQNTELWYNKIFNTPKDDKWKIDRSKSWLIKDSYRDTFNDVVQMNVALANWDTLWALALYNPMKLWRLKYSPLDKDWNVKKRSDRSLEEDQKYKVANTYLLQESIKWIEDLPINNAQKVWMYASLIQKWWYDTLADMETIKDLSPQAAWVFESIKRSLYWQIMWWLDVWRDALISEAERLSWLDINWTGWNTASSWSKSS